MTEGSARNDPAADAEPTPPDAPAPDAAGPPAAEASAAEAAPEAATAAPPPPAGAALEPSEGGAPAEPVPAAEGAPASESAPAVQPVASGSSPNAAASAAGAADAPGAPGQAPAAPTDDAGAPGDAGPPTAAPGARARGRSALRQRMDADRRARDAAHGPRSRGLARVALGVLVVVALGFALRAPAYRFLARRDGLASRWAVRQLALLRDPSCFDLYVAALGRDDERERFGVVVFQLAGREELPEEDVDGAVGAEVPERCEEHRATLLDHLRTGSRAEQRGALYALWLLKERDWTLTRPVQEAAAELLGSEDVVTRRYAALLLTAAPAPESTWDALATAALLEAERDPRVRRYAVKALGETGDRVHVARLTAALQDEKQEVRRQAAFSLAQLEAVVPIETLEAMVRAEEPERRAEILAAVAKQPGPRATALLLGCLFDPAPATRLAAIEGLRGREDERIRDALERALLGDEPRVRIQAAKALAERSDGARAVPVLVEALTHAEVWNELLELHHALEALTGAEVPSPTPEPSSWDAVRSGWQAVLDERGR